MKFKQKKNQKNLKLLKIKKKNGKRRSLKNKMKKISVENF